MSFFLAKNLSVYSLLSVKLERKIAICFTSQWKSGFKRKVFIQHCCCFAPLLAPLTPLLTPDPHSVIYSSRFKSPFISDDGTGKRCSAVGNSIPSANGRSQVSVAITVCKVEYFAVARLSSLRRFFLCLPEFIYIKLIACYI